MWKSSHRQAAGYFAAAAGAALLVSVLGMRLSSSASAQDTALLERVQRIEDEKEIRDLMVRYAQYHDATDYAAYSQLFAEDGEWSGLLGEFRTIKGGPEKIRATMEKQFADRKYDPEHITNLHLITNVRITLDGNRATGYSRWTVLSRNANDEPYLRLSGRYEDVFVREAGQWKFQSRVTRREIP